MGSDYDIFVGIVWSRIGTPTPRNKSGTVEEFESAFARNQDQPGSVAIMLYFKNESLPPESIDLDQLRQVREFQSDISGRGIYFHRFATSLDLERSITQHLSQVLGAISKKASVSGNSSSRQADKIDETVKAVSEQNDVLDDPDIGFIDAEEIALEASNRLTEDFLEISSGLERMTTSLQSLTQRMQKAETDSEKKVIIRASSGVFNEISELIEAMVLSIKNKQQMMCLATIKSIDLREIKEISTNSNIQNLYNSIDGVADNYITMRDNLGGMMSVIDHMPKFELEFNRSRRRLMIALVAMMDEFTIGEKLMRKIRGGASPT